MIDRWITLAALLAATIASGCGSTAEPPGGRKLVSFAVTPQDTAVREGITTVTPGARRIILRGAYIAPNPCLDLQPSVDDDGSEITFTITGRQAGQVCPAVLAYYAYTAVLGHFFPGTYRVKVIHKDSGGTRSIFSGSVVIDF